MGTFKMFEEIEAWQRARVPKKQSPSAKQLLDQKLAITDQQIDAMVCELYGLSEDEIRIVD